MRSVPLFATERAGDGHPAAAGGVHRAWWMLAAMLLVAAACGGDDGGGRRVVTEADSTSEVALAVGDELEVRLAANPTTGYSWRIDPAPTVVRLRSSTFEEADVADDRVGVGGTEVFVFEAVAAGAEVLRLDYVRPFDDPIVPEQVVEYIVRVDGAPWPPTDVSPPATATAE